MNRARLRELGFELGARAEAGVSDEGAWFATAPDGALVMLKWFPDETAAERYASLLPALDELRSRGVPVPDADPAWFPTDSYTWTCTPTTSSPATTTRSPGSSTGRTRAPAIPASLSSDSHTTSTATINRSGTSSRPPGSSRALRAYVAHHALRCTSWQIHHHTDDVPRQLDRAERVLDRYEA